MLSAATGGWARPVDQLRTEVLEDELSIRIRNVKPEFIAVFFERRRVVRFADRAAIERHATVVLPESLDPPYDRQHTPWVERHLPATPRWLNVRIDNFSAWRYGDKGPYEELPVVTTLQREELQGPHTIEFPLAYRCTPQGVMPGDTIEYRWKYMVPYDSNEPHTRGWRGLRWWDNWARLTSWRVFFHGELPIAHQRVEIVYDRRQGLVTGGEPPVERHQGRYSARLVWEQHHLPGCMGEVNARPATDLPHIVVQLSPEDFRYWRRDRLSGIAFQQPYWIQVVRRREARAFWWRQVSRKRVPDKQNQLVKDFVRREGGPDPDPLHRMRRIHDHIARHFIWESDRDRYLDLDQGNARIGEQLQDGRIRDINRYDLYAKLLNELRLWYSTAYVLDKRIGVLTPLYLTPVWDSEFLIGLLGGDGMLWMHPKRNAPGLLTGELPFYWEGTRALLVDLELLLDDLPPPPVFTDLPVSDALGNVRGIEYTLDVDLAQGTLSGQARVFLSGQYSTMGRAAFLGQPIDSTIAPLYGQRPWDITGVLVRDKPQSELSTEPPFRFRSTATVEVLGRITALPDSSWSIALTGLGAHVVPQGFQASTRVLPFHWDFAGMDRVMIDLRFSHPVVTTGLDALTEERRCASAIWQRKAFQWSPQRVVIDSRLDIQGHMEEVGTAASLEDLLNAAAGTIAVSIGVMRAQADGP